MGDSNSSGGRESKSKDNKKSQADKRKGSTGKSDKQRSAEARHRQRVTRGGLVGDAREQSKKQAEREGRSSPSRKRSETTRAARAPERTTFDVPGGTGVRGTPRKGPLSEDRMAKEYDRQRQWREAHLGTTSNEYRRNPKTGRFEKTRTDYGRDFSDKDRGRSGWTQHGSITDEMGTRQYTGRWGDTAFGRDVGSYGRGATAEEAEGYMQASQNHVMADNAWTDGRYGDWLSLEMEATTMDVGNALSSGWEDFKNAPLDFTADMARNPFIGAATALLAPPLSMGLAGIKIADSTADYFQGELGGKEAIRQGAGDIAGSLRDQGLATIAHFVNDPEGTLSGQVGSGIQRSIGQSGMVGAALAVAAPALVGSGVDALTGGDALAGTKGILNSGQASSGEAVGTAQLSSGERDSGIAMPSSLSASGPSMVTQRVGGGGVQVNPNWQVGVQELYGLNELPKGTPTPSTFGVTGAKISQKSKTKASSLIENYPWLFGQSILEKPTNPYAVTG